MTIEEANKLIRRYVKLREKVKIPEQKEKFIAKFKQHQALCVQKFKYLVLMKTNRYKSFSNYEDLNQEGLEALIKGMNTYNPSKKGNVFWWLHKYIDTRISRCANLHTTIRFPLKYAKQHSPRRESCLPTMIDYLSNPHELLEQAQIIDQIKQSFVHLSAEQQRVTKMLFGIDGESVQSVSNICKNLRISRVNCNKVLDQVASILKQNIEL